MLRHAMLNNCKDKGKIRKNFRVGIFIKQHLGIAGTDAGQCGGVVAAIKA